MMKLTRDRAPHEALTSPRAAAENVASGKALQRQLRGMSFAEGESALSPTPKAEPPSVQLKGGGGLVTGGPRLVEVQEALNDQGFDCGTADGVMGPQTRAAVVAFQREHGLAPDGLIGPATLRAIQMDEGGGMQAGRVALEREEADAEAEEEAGGEEGGGMQAGRIAREREEAEEEQDPRGGGMQAGRIALELEERAAAGRGRPAGASRRR